MLLDVNGLISVEIMALDLGHPHHGQDSAHNQHAKYTTEAWQ
jgi:hypothetical protein